MSTFTTYRNGFDTQLVKCGCCGHKKISPLNTNWEFPCLIKYHCSKCGNVGDIYYTENCILAYDVEKLKNTKGLNNVPPLP